MACTNPQIMKVIDSKSYNMNLIYRLKELGWKFNADMTKAYRLVSRESRNLPLEHIPSWSCLEDMEVPCGHCVQCRLDYSKNWASRCYFESLYHKHNYFVTLTYEDDHISLGKYGNPTLVREHFTQFIKRLRMAMERKFGHTGIRYFGCGEYGDQTMRPHLHIILFNCPIPDLSINFVDDEGQITQRKSRYGFMYFSKFIKDLWPYGFITVEDANYNTEAYVSRYIMKKQKGQEGKEVYEKKLGVLPPFLAMSLKPAIGSQYFEDNEKWLIDHPSIIVPRGDKEPLVSGIPRFYKHRILDRHPEVYDAMIEKAKINTLKARSLLKGKKKINDQRQSEEEHIEKAFGTFGRNAI